VEYEDGDGGRVVERVARITRDALDPSSSTQTVRVMIVGVAVLDWRTDRRAGESADTAQVFTLDENGGVSSMS
jgi:hypothetical protein